jgi:hypothetical protein
LALIWIGDALERLILLSAPPGVISKHGRRRRAKQAIGQEHGPRRLDMRQISCAEDTIFKSFQELSES